MGGLALLAAAAIGTGVGVSEQKKKDEKKQKKKFRRRENESVEKARREAATDRFGRSLLDDGSSSLLGGRPDSVRGGTSILG